MTAGRTESQLMTFEDYLAWEEMQEDLPEIEARHPLAEIYEAVRFA